MKYDEIRERVLETYKQKYPEWENTEVTEIMENKYFDTVVSVRSEQYPDGEICIYNKSQVRIFDTTPELVRYIDLKASRIITMKEILTAVVVVAMLAIFAGVVFIQENDNAIALVTTSMAGILGTIFGIKFNNKDE